jgi:hypothetical protein
VDSKQIVSKVIAVKLRMTAISKAKALQTNKELAVKEVKILATSKVAPANKE